MQQIENAVLKALFGQLVEAVGKQDAAAAYLGISRQRVGQIISAKAEHRGDLPTWGQVWTLERACGQSIVFGALARMTEGDAPADVMASSIAAVTASSDALRCTADMMADNVLEPHELRAALEAARLNREKADAHHDGLLRLKAQQELRAV